MERLLPFLFIFLLACGENQEQKEQEVSKKDEEKSSQQEGSEPEKAEKRLGIDTLVSVASSVEKTKFEVPEGRPVEEVKKEGAPLPILGTTTQGAKRVFEIAPYRVVEFKSIAAAQKAYEELEARSKKDELRLEEGSHAIAFVQHYVLHCRFACEATPKEDAKYRSWRKWTASLGEPSDHFLVACKG